jgi:hypothetical protein
VRSSVARIACAAGLAGAIFVSVAAGPPEIVRVRAAASEIGRWFPQGTELLSLRPDEFDRLVKGAQDRIDVNERETARLVEAIHRIRWEGGILVGETSLAVLRDPAAPRVLPLSPWGLPTNTANADILTCDDGRVFLRVDPAGSGAVSVAWRREAVPSSDGRLFALELPRAPLQSIELDLPDRFVPEGFSSSSPSPDAARGGRRVWRQSGLTSPFEIRLSERNDLDRSELERPWISGPTTIDVGSSSATWRADWTAAIPRARSSVRLVFSPGLQPIDVAGPEVESTRLLRVGDRAEMTLRFRPEFRGTTTLVARGVAPIGSEGAWTLPASWPADGEWLGGQVIVRLDRTREVESCRVIQGRRLPVTTEDAAARVALRFEPALPGPVAALSFLRSDPSRRARIRSWVRCSGDRSDLLADVTWTFASGLPGEFELDLPEGWSVDRVTADDVPLSWHGAPAGKGSKRVHLTAGSIDANTTSYSARIHAVGPAPVGDGAFDLPRIIPVAASADTLGLATAADGRHVVPTRFDGVAWLEARSFDDEALAALIDPGELSGALAWRGIGEREQITASVVSSTREMGASAEGAVIISSARMHVDWRLTIRPGNHPLSSIPIAWSAESANPVRWRLRRPGFADLSLSARPLTMPERASIGLDHSTPGAMLELPGPVSSPIIVECEAEQTWDGRGSVPLLLLPPEYNLRGNIAVHVGAWLIARLDMHDVRATEGRESDVAQVRIPPPHSAEPTRLDHLLSYRSPEARLAIETRPSLASSCEAVVSADLDTRLESDGTKAHDLTLRILAGAPRELEFSLPGAAEIRSVRLGESIVEVTGQGPTFSVPISRDSTKRVQDLRLAYVERPSGSIGRTYHHWPTLPVLRISCVAFRWTVHTRHGYSVGRVGGGLTTVDPFPSRPASLPWAGGIGSLLASPGDARRAADDRSTIAELDRRLATLESTDSMDLGQALASLARSDLTLVVDLPGLREAGLSPGSAWSPATPAVPPVATSLRRGGLYFLARRGVVAVTGDSTSLDEVLREKASAAELDRSLQEAARRGVSADGRWVALEEWHSEPFDRGASTSRGTTIAGDRVVFACNGWPGNDAWIEEISTSGGPAGVAVGLSLWIIAGLVARRMTRPRRCMFLFLATIAGSIAIWAAAGTAVDGLRWGVLLGIISAWLMQHSSAEAGRKGRPATSHASRTLTTQAATAGLVLFAFCWASLERSKSYGSDSSGEVRERILAILPLDGPDPQAAPTRVILRLQDFLKLQDAGSKITDHPEVFALEAAHQVRILDARSALLTSTITLSVDADLPRQWRFPTATAREIRAWLDDRPHPVRIDDEGHFGAVALAGRGQHRLRLERTIPVGGRPGFPSIAASVNSVPSARLGVVAPPPWSPMTTNGSQIPPAEASNERERSVGCAQSINLMWDADSKSTAQASQQVHGLILWDVLPAGDRIRLRLAPVGPGHLQEIRLGLETGVGIRALEHRRVIRSSSGRTAAGVEWSATLDRPGTMEDPIELEIWRPGPDPVAPAMLSSRHCPRIHVIGVNFQGTIALRRPPDWSGRLTDTSGVVPRDDESFVKAWGRLPDDTLTLAGAIGFRDVAAPELVIKPIPVERSARISALLDLGEGRVGVTIQSVIQDVAARSSHVDLELSPSFVLEAADAPGLLRASSPRKGLIHVELVSIPTTTRKVTIRGSIPCDIKSAEDGRGTFEVSGLWPRWINTTEEAGVLMLSASTRPALDPGPGVAEVPAEEPLIDPKQGALFRKSYKIERGAVVGAVRWDASPPRVAVAIQSRLAIDGQISNLDASIKYDVMGGPLDTIHLKMPSEWAQNATIQLIDRPFRSTAESRGGWTFWTIRTPQPIWGAARLRVSSSRANELGSSFSFPDILPLGQGQVEKLISVEKHTSRPIEIEGSSGVLAVEPVRLAEESPDGASPATSVGAYRVTAEKWVLSIRIGGDPRHDSNGGLARVLDSETSCTLRGDGKLLGTTTWLIEAGVGNSLRFDLGPHAKVLYAREAGTTLPVLSPKPGAWIVPFGSAGVREVEVLWTDDTADPGGAGGEIRLPRSAAPGGHTLVHLSTKPGTAIVKRESGFEPISGSRWRIERVERLARRIAGLLDDFDRSSPQQGSTLASLLIRFADEARLADRAIRSPETANAVAAGSSGSRELERMERSRTAISEGLDLYGLDEFQSYLGSPAATNIAAKTAYTSALEEARLSFLGDATYYRSTSGETEADPTLPWEIQEPPRPPAFGIASAVALALIAGVLLPRSLGLSAFRAKAVGFALTMLLLLFAAIAPLPGAILLLAAWVGRH